MVFFSACFEDANVTLVEELVLSSPDSFGSSYDDFPSNQKETQFIEDFNNPNSNLWYQGTSNNNNFSIEDGQYIMDNNNSNSFIWQGIVSDLNQNKDFEIEALVFVNQGQDSYGAGIYIGDPYEERLNLLVSRKEEISLSVLKKETDYSEQNPIIDWTEFSALNIGSLPDKLTIRKFGSNYYFFINEVFLNVKMPYENFGNEIGFLVESNVRVEIDYLKISYLN